MKRTDPKLSKVPGALLAALLVVLLWPGSAWAAAQPSPDQSSRISLGSSHWRDLLSLDLLSRDLGTTTAWMQIGGQGLSDQPGEFGGGAAQRESKSTGPSHLGEKFKAGFLSALLPGAGQYYNGRHQKAYIMGGLEVAIWGTYFVFDTQGDNGMDDARDFAGIYAGTQGSHDANYWQNVSRYMDSDAFNMDREREARALQEPVSGLIDSADAWQWANSDRFFGYRKLRADATNAYDRRDFMILFAVVNRAVAVFDAVMGAGKDDSAPGTEILGMNVRLEMSPVWTSPTARCVVSRGF